MPAPRQPYGLNPHVDSLQLSGSPNLLDLIPSWHAEARCSQEPDADLAERSFFFEVPLFHQSDPQFVSSPSTTYAFLLCSDCSVRRQCLRAALAPPRWAVREDDLHTLGSQERPHRVFGVWGGSVELERYHLRDHPVDEATEILESTFQERLQRRLAAYWEARNLRTPRWRRDKRIDELLEERQVKTPLLEELAQELGQLRAAKVLIRAAAAAKITRLECVMPECRCPYGRGYFQASGEGPFSLWAPSADRWPIPAREGGRYVIDNVRLAHVHCNNVEGGFAGASKQKAGPGPGPGRGHLGPAGRYARDHSVSLSTARRRLRAAA